MCFDIYVSFIIVTTKTNIFIMKAMSLSMDKKVPSLKRRKTQKTMEGIRRNMDDAFYIHSIRPHLISRHLDKKDNRSTSKALRIRVKDEKFIEPLLL